MASDSSRETDEETRAGAPVSLRDRGTRLEPGAQVGRYVLGTRLGAGQARDVANAQLEAAQKELEGLGDEILEQELATLRGRLTSGRRRVP